MNEKQAAKALWVMAQNNITDYQFDGKELSFQFTDISIFGDVIKTYVLKPISDNAIGSFVDGECRNEWVA